MRTKKKISLTIDSGMLEAIESASKRYRMAKSHLAQEAFALWLKSKTEDLMAKGYMEMAEEDRGFAEATLCAQSEVLV
ncbi:MAG: hypothetical protein V2B19_29435 [Pseudomonadota bacterium]